MTKKLFFGCIISYEIFRDGTSGTVLANRDIIIVRSAFVTATPGIFYVIGMGHSMLNFCSLFSCLHFVCFDYDSGHVATGDCGAPRVW